MAQPVTITAEAAANKLMRREDFNVTTMSAIFATKNDVTASAKIIDIHITRPEGWEALSRQLTQAQRNFAEARQFTGGAGQKLQMPNAEGVIESVLYGAGPMSKDELGAMRAGGLSGSLTQGFYRFASLPQDWDICPQKRNFRLWL